MINALLLFFPLTTLKLYITHKTKEIFSENRLVNLLIEVFFIFQIDKYSLHLEN
jgi:hypothetical protein